MDSRGPKLIIHAVGTKAFHAIDLPPHELGDTTSVLPMSFPSIFALRSSKGGTALVKIVAGVKSPRWLTHQGTGTMSEGIFSMRAMRTASNRRIFQHP